MPAKKVETNEGLNKNVRFYSKFMTTPPEAKKSFKGKGGFEGTDINPMYRIKALTEVFGPVGFGWWTNNVRYQFVESPSTKETHVFCELDLYVKDPETGEVSQPIYGIGGNTYITTNKYGPTATDEAKKMAYTDAMSIACKALGIGHDVWYMKDRTKYTNPDFEETPPKQTTEDKPKIETAKQEATKQEVQKEEPKAEPPKQEHTPQTAEVIDEITAKLAEMSPNMTKEQKHELVNNMIIPTIGQSNWKTCTDLTKLIELRNKLIA